LMGKLRKSKASPAASATPIPQDEAVLDDLFTQLDVQEKNKPPSGMTPSGTNPATSSSEKKMTMNGAMSSAKARFKAREARKIQKMQSSYVETDAANDARFEQEAREEERDITRICDQLGLEMIEIAPDGHCLFAAVADQLSIHGIIPRSAASYAATRATAAHHMMQHRDDFLPFLPSVDGEDGAGATESEGMMSQRDFQMYCASIRDTAAWGGEPEIMALSRAYNVPIHVVQAGKPPVVIHEPLPNMSDHLDAKIVFISYHRRMYGLGEHYNSLRPKSKLPNMIRAALR